ncbi:hypothetical protein [Enterococcus lactis]|uniref:hypothetical protein n=1 Tax=Enterococcus lactis TaxID=357441 RepID=UPI0040422A9F
MNKINEIFLCKSEMFEYEFIGVIKKNYTNSCLVEILICSKDDYINEQQLQKNIIVRKRDISKIEKSILLDSLLGHPVLSDCFTLDKAYF